MTGNTQSITDEARVGQMRLVDSGKTVNVQIENQTSLTNDMDGHTRSTTIAGSQPNQTIEQTNAFEGQEYWKTQYQLLKNDYDHLQKVNQNLEEKLLNVVETYEKKGEEMLANAEFEKTTLMADVNKLSTKLVDARMKLHDREEKDILHAAECDAPCHSKVTTSQGIPIVPTNQRTVSRHKIDQQQKQQMLNDPNLV